jgi:excisionase family DNA binding protein
MSLVTCKTIAGLLGVSPATLNRMINVGEIPYIDLGRGERKRRLRFDLAVVEKWIKNRSVAARDGKKLARSPESISQVPDAATQRSASHPSSSQVPMDSPSSLRRYLAKEPR